MRWSGREESSNVEDRRGVGARGLFVGGSGLVILVVAWLLGIDPSLLFQLQSELPSERTEVRSTPEEDRLASFTKVILRDTELVWTSEFRQVGRPYVPPTLVLYGGVVESACGFAQAAVGPFYCPGDTKVYIDLSFYKDMERSLGAPGDFAKAYVVAHEVGHHVGHHVQHLLGWEKTFGNSVGQHAARGSVQRELQADYLAGVWANHAEKKFRYLEPGDLQTALNAAFQIGDDRLQSRSKGYVVPDSFTHGSSEQRVRAFRSGFESGDLRAAQTFVR